MARSHGKWEIFRRLDGAAAISLIYPKRKGPAVECPLSAISGLMYCNRKSLSDHLVGAGEQRCRLQVSILGRSLNAILEKVGGASVLPAIKT